MVQTSILPSIATGRYDARLQALRAAGNSKEFEEARLEEVAKEFETLMVEIMVRSMRKNVPESSLLGESNAREIFQDMLDGQYARLMVERRGFGIAEALKQQLLKKL